MEINKIITAIIVTIIVVVGIGKISDIIYKVDRPGQAAYKVDEPEGSTDNQKTSESTTDLNALMALADLSHGQTVFKKCKACHSIKKGGKNATKPAPADLDGDREETEEKEKNSEGKKIGGFIIGKTKGKGTFGKVK